MKFDPDYSERPSGRQLALRGGLIAAGVLVIGSLAGLARGARANDAEATPSVAFASREVGQLRQELEAARGDLEVARVSAERAQTIIRYSGQYQIPADLAAAIYDVALSEGIDPRIGFRLVQVESTRESYDALQPRTGERLYVTPRQVRIFVEEGSSRR